MKWVYRVLSLDELFPEHVDHDIAVSKQAATSRRAKLSSGFEESLNQVGSNGWELVTIMAEFGIFKKPRED